MKAVGTGLCLLVGVVLVGVQVFASVRDVLDKKAAAAAPDKVEGAARKVQGAAEKLRAAADNLSATTSDLHGRLTSPSFAPLTQIDVAQHAERLAESSDAAGKDADEAKKKAEEGQKEAEAAKGANQFDVVNTLAGKVPLAVTGLVFFALGFFIQGWIAVSAAAGGG